jgi:hypothetical protein
MHGRFHVRRNSGGKEVVTEDNERPVRNLKRLGHEEMTKSSAEDADLTPADFKAAIKQKVEASGRVDSNHPAQ